MKNFFFFLIFIFNFNFLLSQNPCDSLEAYFDATCINVSGGVEPYSFLWVDNNNGFSFICNSENGCLLDCESYDFCPGNYSVVVQDANQCTTSVSFLIENINIDFDINNLYINNISGGVGDYEINWYQNGFLLDTLVYQGYNLCFGDYYIEVVDSESCSDTLFFNIDSISADFDFENLTIDNIQGGTPPYSFLWFDNNDTIYNNYSNFVTGLCEGNYYVSINDINNCFLDIYFQVDKIDTDLESTIECSNNDFNGDIVVSASGGVPPYSYVWNYNDTEIYGNEINNLSPGVYFLNTYDSFNCLNEDSIVLNPLTSDCIFNVFSPNNDNVNDVWGIEGSFLFPESNVIIYNRYGRKVFQSEGNKSVKWEGLNINNQKLSEGIYYYVITLKDNIPPYKGFISLFD